jgi:hypothetical protein
MTSWSYFTFVSCFVKRKGYLNNDLIKNEGIRLLQADSFAIIMIVQYTEFIQQG